MNILKRIKKNKYVRPVRLFVGYIIFLACYKIIRLLPWRVVIFMGRNFGRFVFYVIRYARKRTLDNLQAAFGGTKSRKEIIKIAAGVYENFGMTAFEFLKAPHLSRKEFLSIVDYDESTIGASYRLAGEGKGVIVASAHMGNWEILALLGAHLKINMSVLVEPSTNPYINRLYQEMRGENKLIDVTKEFVKIVPRLRSGEIICLLFDENARENGMLIDFFGRPASTYKGPAYFAIRTGAPILCMYIIRAENGRHRLVAGRTIRPKPTGDINKDIEDILKLLNSDLEEVILKYPQQWNWLYKRW